jgi:voltage-dependent anion channel protein 2
MVCKFSDIAKAPTDLLNDDFTTKVSLKCKKSAGPVAVTIDTTRGKDGSLSSKVGGKFNYNGISFDKVQHEADGSHTLESSFVPAPGLKLSFKGSKGADLGCDYKSGNLCATAKLDIKDLAKFSTSACMSVAGGITMGGDVAYSLKDSALSGYNIGASYSTGPLFAAVTTSNKLGSVNLSMMYKVNNDLTLVSSTSHSSSKTCTVSGVGGLYKASFGDVKAKLGADKLVSASLVKDVSKTKVTLSGSMVGTDTSTFKYGLGIAI